MKPTYIFPITFNLLLSSFQAHAMNPYAIEEKIYDPTIRYSYGSLNHYKEGTTTLSTQSQSPQTPYNQRAFIYNKNPEEWRREKILKRVIPGQDGRTRVTNPAEWPHSVCTQLSMIFKGQDYGGSGVLVGPQQILTCGHNVYDPDEKTWADTILVYPALDEAHAPFGEVKVAKAYTFKGWVHQGQQDLDMALLILSKPIGKHTGWGGLLSLDDTALAQEKVHITGYPGDGDKKCKQMWTMSHTLKTFQPEQFYYEIDTYGGQSGSPIWINKWGTPLILGIHTQGSHSMNSGVRISGRKFTNFLLKLISETYNIDTVPTAALSALSLGPTPVGQQTPTTFSSLPVATNTSTQPALLSFEEWRNRLLSCPEPWAKILWEKCISQSITDLILSDDQISDTTAQVFIKGNFTALTSLSFQGDKVSELGIQAITSGNLTALTSLNLGGNNINAAGAQALATGNLISLITLELYDNSIGDAGAEAFSIGTFSTGNLTTLTKLDLYNNQIGNPGVQALAKGNFPALTILDLQNNFIGDPGAQVLSIGQLIALTELNLSGNQVGPSGCKALTRGKLTALTNLDLSCNQIGDEGIQAFAEGNLPVLAILKASNNLISGTGVRAFTKGNLPALTELHLDYNQIDNVTREVLKTKYPVATIVLGANVKF